MPHVPTCQLYTEQGPTLHVRCRGCVCSTPAQTDAGLMLVLLALAMQTASRLLLPPPQLALQLPQGLYSQWRLLQPAALCDHAHSEKGEAPGVLWVLALDCYEMG